MLPFGIHTRNYFPRYVYICLSDVDYCSVAISSSGQLLFWGGRFKIAPQTDSRNWLNPGERRQNSASSLRSMSQTSLNSTALNRKYLYNPALSTL